MTKKSKQVESQSPVQGPIIVTVAGPVEAAIQGIPKVELVNTGQNHLEVSVGHKTQVPQPGKKVTFKAFTPNGQYVIEETHVSGWIRISRKGPIGQSQLPIWVFPQSWDNGTIPAMEIS